MRAFIASFDAVVALLIALALTATIMNLFLSYSFDLSKITIARTAQDILVLAEEKKFDPTAIQQIFEMSPFCHVLEIYDGDTLVEVHMKAGCENPDPTTKQITWSQFYNGQFYLAKLESW